MPQYTKRHFQIGDYWLSQRGNSPAWCRTWFDNNTRQTRRSSLGTTDIEEAKQKLTDWFVLNNTPSSNKAEDHSLAEIIARYWEHHGQHLPSAERTRISLQYWLTFYMDRTVADISDADLQGRFHVWLKDKGMKGTSVSRVLGVGRAAINYAWKRGEIKNVPFILGISKEDKEASPPKGRPMEIEEISELFGATQNPKLKMFIVLMLATAGRPDAIRELTVGQCDVQNRLIHLNPKDRQQTTKYRPTVRMPENIVPLIESYHGMPSETCLVGGAPTPLKSVRTTWRTARKNANLDDHVNPYSLRHTMARWLRKQGVPPWEISSQLGHKRQELSITEVYAPYDPTYLSEATKAIDYFFAELRVKSVLVDAMLKELIY